MYAVAFVYSASIDLLRLLWALVSPSLLGRQSHPAKEQWTWCRGVRRTLRVGFRFVHLFVLKKKRGSDPAVTPHRKYQSDTYRNTWLSRGSRLSRLSWITLVQKTREEFLNIPCIVTTSVLQFQKGKQRKLTTPPLDPFVPTFP